MATRDGSTADSGGSTEPLSPKAQCVEATTDVFGGRLNGMMIGCVDCLCTMAAEETAACDVDCWKLAECIFVNGCANNDTTCIVAACTDRLGDSARLAAAGMLLRAVPLVQCDAHCTEHPPDPDGGD